MVEEPKESESSYENKLSSAWPAEIQQWKGLIEKYSYEYSLDPDLVGAVMYIESWFNPATYPAGLRSCPDGPSTSSCTSYAGAMGMMQVMPFHFKEGEDGRDPETNIKKGTAILRAYLNEMGSIDGGLAAYNAGPRGARLGGGWDYAVKVLNAYKKYGGK